MRAFCFIRHNGKLEVSTIMPREIDCKVASINMLTNHSVNSASDDEISGVFLNLLGADGFIGPVKIERDLQ